MSPTTIKVTYFTIKGLGESIRMLLKYGGIDFEDVRLENDKWHELKESTPFGQMPLYEEDGKVSAQSVAIARYVAKKVDLVGGNDWENLEIDAVVDTINDVRLKLTDRDPARQLTLKDSVPFYLERLDKIAETNGGHLAIGKLTWADIFFASFSTLFEIKLGEDIFQKYPNLQAVINKVLEIPNIKAWVESRPKTNY